MKTLLYFVFLLIAASPVAAHEYWFAPDSFFLIPHQSTNVHLFVGEALKMDEERVYQGSKTASFQMFGPSGTFDLRSMSDEEKSPILKFASDSAGTFLFSMERNWSYITLEAGKFEDYLRDEGMEYIIPQRAKLGESKKEGKERYSRFLKTLVQVGDSRTGIVKDRVNTKLEIVPLDNPYSKRTGQTLPFQIWFDRRPLANYAVFADNRDGKDIVTQKLTADKDGVVNLKLTRRGIWLVRLVVMKRCEKHCEGADWESFWGALSFGVK
ncbi:DUF4198 domain-containing protein [soil metagenome]